MRVRIPSVTFKAILRKRIRFDGFIKEKPQHFMKMPASRFDLPVFVLYFYRICSVLFSGRNAYAFSKFSLTACHMNNLAT